MSDSAVWVMLLAAFGATFVWRAAGAVLAGRIRVDSALFEWAGCVSYALVAGLMIRAIFFTEGPLGSVPVADRIIAVGVGFAVFLLTRRSVPKSVSVGTALFAALAFWRSGFFG
ncbi:MAG: AzlD domain-containing protein [Rhodospirillales bacterium]